MNIFQRLQLAGHALGFGTLSTKASRAANAIAMNVIGRPVWTGRDFAKFADEGYRRNPIVYMAVNKLATSMAKVPLCVYVGDKEAEPGHPLAKLLKRPNSVTGGAAFWRNHFGFWLLAGNCYLEANGPGGEVGAQFQVDLTGKNPPSELWTLRPDRVQVVAGKSAIPMGFVYRVNGLIRTWECDDLNGLGPILHTKFFNPLDDWYGMAPIEAAAYSVDVFNSTAAHNKALLDNGARPSGAMVYQPKTGPGTLTADQFERLKGEMQAQYQGAKNTGRPLLLDGGMTWEQMGMTPAEMDFIEGKHMNAREIVMCFGTPPQLLGIPGDNTFSNAKEARQSFYEDTVLPTLDLALDDLNGWLAPQFGADVHIRPDIDEIDALAPRRAEKWTQVSAAPFLTLNEKRTALEYEPWDNESVEGPADELYMPAGVLPLSSDGAGVGSADGASGDAAAGDGAGAGAGKPGADGAAVPAGPAGDANAAPADGVQAAALNGAQLTGMQGIIQAVADGDMPAEAALAMLLVGFPLADPAKLKEMVDAAAKHAEENPKPSPEEMAAAMAGQGAPAGQPTPGGKPPRPGAKPGAKPVGPIALGKRPVPGAAPKPPAAPAAGKAATREDDQLAAKAVLADLGFSADDADALAKELDALAYGPQL